MNYITTTQLRTKTSSLLEAILAGKSVQLIHRSQVVAKISPSQDKPPQPFDGKEYLALTKNLKTRKLSEAERQKNYHEHIMKKYGHNLS